MGLRVCVLGSGSAGNCTYVASATTRILVDAGLSGKETQRRLALLGESLDAVHGVCVTHEHDDHRAALSVLQRRLGLQLYANSGTADAIEARAKTNSLRWNVFITGQDFLIGDLKVHPFMVPHDAYEPVGFTIEGDGVRVGVVTDLGLATATVRERLKSCDAIVIECNHDEEMLKNSDRPWSLKQRIVGRQGHFSNRQAAELLAEIGGARLRTVFLAHLSSDCNRPELALNAVNAALAVGGLGHVRVHLTFADRPSDHVALT